MNSLLSGLNGLSAMMSNKRKSIVVMDLTLSEIKDTASESGVRLEIPTEDTPYYHAKINVGLTTIELRSRYYKEEEIYTLRG